MAIRSGDRVFFVVVFFARGTLPIKFLWQQPGGGTPNPARIRQELSATLQTISSASPPAISVKSIAVAPDCSIQPIDQTTCVRRQQAAGTFSKWLQPEVVAAACVENEMVSVLLNQRSIERNRPVNPLSRHHLRVSSHENGEGILAFWIFGAE